MKPLIFSDLSPRFEAPMSFGDSDVYNILNPHLLKIMVFASSKITDEAIKFICSHCHAVQVLDFDGTQISDAGLKKLVSLDRLKELWLEETLITDVGLIALSQCRELRYISALDTDVTEEGTRAFLQVNSLCEIKVG